MNIPNRQINWIYALDKLEGAYSPHTLRGYRADFVIFEAWCRKTKQSPLPATPETVANFITAQTATCSASTLKHRIASIRKIHRLMRLPSPTEDEDVAIALRRAFRQKRRRPKQALGITSDRLAKLLSACGDDLIGKRNRAMLQTAYDTLCRRAELVALRVEDIQEAENGGARILIRRSKNDPFGDGRYGRLSQAALEALKSWLHISKIKSGFIFKATNNGRVTKDGLHPYAVNRTVKELALTAGFDEAIIADLSGHSFRVGAAQDLMTDGKSILAIMKAGGWRSMNVVGRYVENADF